MLFIKESIWIRRIQSKVRSLSSFSHRRQMGFAIGDRPMGFYWRGARSFSWLFWYVSIDFAKLVASRCENGLGCRLLTCLEPDSHPLCYVFHPLNVLFMYECQVQRTLKPSCSWSQGDKIMAIGINCSAPQYIEEAISGLLPSIFSHVQIVPSHLLSKSH